MQIDTGDSVLHKPTGEQWLVACVEGDRLSWCGWPEGTANLNDCELIKKATDTQRTNLLIEMAQPHRDDHRARYARHRLANESNGEPKP